MLSWTLVWRCVKSWTLSEISSNHVIEKSNFDTNCNLGLIFNHEKWKTVSTIFRQGREDYITTFQWQVTVLHVIKWDVSIAREW